jgi:hypothetical protein
MKDASLISRTSWHGQRPALLLIVNPPFLKSICEPIHAVQAYLDCLAHAADADWPALSYYGIIEWYIVLANIVNWTYLSMYANCNVYSISSGDIGATVV